MKGVRKSLFLWQEKMIFSGVSPVEGESFVAEESVLEFGVPFLHFPTCSSVSRGLQPVPVNSRSHHLPSGGEVVLLPQLPSAVSLAEVTAGHGLLTRNHVVLQLIAVFFSNAET